MIIRVKRLLLWPLAKEGYGASVSVPTLWLDACRPMG